MAKIPVSANCTDLADRATILSAVCFVIPRTACSRWRDHDPDSEPRLRVTVPTALEWP